MRKFTSLNLITSTVLLLSLAGCAEDKPLNTFEPRGPKAREIYDLSLYLWVIMALVAAGVLGVTFFLAFKNRVNGDELDPNDLPEQTHGNTKLELAWTAAPAILLAVLCVPIVQGIWNLEKESPGDEVDVMVIGQQWWWEYRYDVDGDGFFVEGDEDLVKELPVELALDPDDISTATELVIPAGKQVDLIIGSRDVIHSFWIPRLNGKRDAVPGRWHTWSVQADEPGKYNGWCTEFCGLSHARMRMSTVALSDADFNEWLENQKSAAEVPTDEAALAGREVFSQNCTSCHSVREEPAEGVEPLTRPKPEDVPLASKVAPDLTHFASRSTFAGGIYSVYSGTGNADSDDLNANDYTHLSTLSKESGGNYRFNKSKVKDWVKDAPGQKDADADNRRGMLSFANLSDEEIDNVATYLATLD